MDNFYQENSKNYDKSQQSQSQIQEILRDKYSSQIQTEKIIGIGQKNTDIFQKQYLNQDTPLQDNDEGTWVKSKQKQYKKEKENLINQQQQQQDEEKKDLNENSLNNNQILNFYQVDIDEICDQSTLNSNLIETKEEIIESTPYQICDIFKNKYTFVKMGYNQMHKVFTITKYISCQQNEIESQRSEWAMETDLIKALATENITLPLITQSDQNIDLIDFQFSIEQVAGQKDLQTLKDNCKDLFINSISNDKIDNYKIYDSFVSVIFLRLLQKLQKMHSLGYAHSDIKPLNIVIGYDFDAYFIDFGGSIQQNNIEFYLNSFTPPFNLQKYYSNKYNQDGKLIGYNRMKFNSWEEVQICDLSQLALSILFLIIQDLDENESNLFKEQKQFSQLLKKYQNKYPKVVYLISYILNQADTNIQVLGSYDQLNFTVDLHDISSITQFVYDVSYNNSKDEFVAKRINNNSIYLINLIDQVFGNIQIDPSQMDIIPLPHNNEYQKMIQRHQIIEKFFEDRQNDSDDLHYLNNLCRQFLVSYNKSFSVQIYNQTQIQILLKGMLNAWQVENQRNLTLVVYINNIELVMKFIKDIQNFSNKYFITGLKVYDFDNKFHKIVVTQNFSEPKAEKSYLKFVFCQYVQPIKFEEQLQQLLPFIKCNFLQINLQIRSESIPPNYNSCPYKCLEIIETKLNQYSINIQKFRLDVSVKTITKVDHQIFQTFEQVNKLTIDHKYDRRTIYSRFYDAFQNNQELIQQEISKRYNVQESESQQMYYKFKRDVENKGVELYQMQRQIQSLKPLIIQEKAVKVTIKYNNFIFNDGKIWAFFQTYLKEKPEVSYEFILNDCFFSEDAFNEVLKLKEINNQISIEYESLKDIPKETYYKLNCQFVSKHSQSSQQNVKIIFRTTQLTNVSKEISNSQNNNDQVKAQKPNIVMNKEDIIKLLDRSDFSKLLLGAESYTELRIPLQQSSKQIKVQFRNKEIDHFTIFKNENSITQKEMKKKQLQYFKKDLSHDFYNFLMKNNSKFINVNFSKFNLNDLQKDFQSDLKIIDTQFFQMYNPEEVVVQNPPKQQQRQFYFAQQFSQYQHQDQEEEFDSHMSVSFKKLNNVPMRKQNFINLIMKMLMKQYLEENNVVMRIAFKLPNQNEQDDANDYIDTVVVKQIQGNISQSIFHSIMKDLVKISSSCKHVYLRNCGINDEHLKIISNILQEQKSQSLYLDFQDNDNLSLVGVFNFLQMILMEINISIEFYNISDFQLQIIESKYKEYKAYYEFKYESEKLTLTSLNETQNDNEIFMKISINPKNKPKINDLDLDNIYVDDHEEICLYEENSKQFKKQKTDNRSQWSSENWIILDDLKYRNYLESYQIDSSNTDKAQQEESQHSDNKIAKVLSEIIEKNYKSQNNLFDSKLAYDKRNQQIKKKIQSNQEMDFDAMNQAALASVMMQLGRKW